MSTKYRFEAVSLTGSSNIKTSYQLGRLDNGARILIVGYEGKYRLGSAGNPDATFMRAMSAAGTEAFGPDAVIFDFSKLNYQWGDMLECVYGTAPAYIGEEGRYAVIVGPESKEAIRTLELGVHSTEPLQAIPWAHETLDSACDYLRTVLG